MKRLHTILIAAGLTLFLSPLARAELYVLPTLGKTGHAVTLLATPPAVTTGASATLTWSSSDSSNCAASGAWSGTKATSGSQVLTNLSATNSYTLTCRGAGGSASQSATVSVTPPLSCADANVLCVDDTPGATQEYATLQAAADAVQPGQTVLVHDGNYAGFQLTRSGSSSAPIVIRAQGTAALINSPGVTGDGVRLQNVNYVTVEGLMIQNVPQRCIAARGANATAPMTNNTLRNNRCNNAGTECFYLSQFANSLVENNTISTCGTGGGIRNHGIYLANGGSDNSVIRNNSISGAGPTESAGIHMNGDLSIGGDGIISGVTIENNVIFGNAHNGVNMDGVQNTLLRNNLIYGNARNAVRAYNTDGAAGPMNLRIVNNTLRASASGWAVKFSEDLGGHSVFNNVLLGVSGSLSVANSAINSNNNAGDDRFSANNDASILTLVQWRSTTGQDANSLLSTPTALFVNAAANDYRLNTSPLSPAINAGRASLNGINAPTSDIVGNARPQGAAYDMGAYERIE